MTIATSVGDVIVSFLILSGVSLSLLAGIGLQRFPDVFARMHAATKPATLGLLLILGAAALRLSDRGGVIKLLVIAAAQFITAPLGAHMVGRAAHRAGDQMAPETTVDELSDVRRRRSGSG
ncbi:MAG: monovalent cation/H(+) antiporter subunit G [Acidimicrobiales bacterium]